MHKIQELRHLIDSCEALLLIFGAGMSVDSGIPDYRSGGGWYDARSPFVKTGKDFMPILHGGELEKNAQHAWGMWGIMQNLFQEAVPHAGYQVLARIAEQKGQYSFVLTSNVDNQAIRAGFAPERIHQCHGRMFQLQCRIPCTRTAWAMPDIDMKICRESLRAEGDLPRCPHCGALARPNVYFFGDSEEKYVWEASQQSATAFKLWLDTHGAAKLLLLEVGCGTEAPGLRHHAEQFLERFPKAHLVRINDVDATGPAERFAGMQGQAAHILGSL